MGNMTLSIPDKLHDKIQKHPEFKWSEIARQAFEEKIRDTEFLDDLKDIAKAEAEHREGKTISQSKLAKELGIENEL